MESIKDRMNEIIEDLKGRVKNPLILSFILVWLYYHWDFVFQMLVSDALQSPSSRLSTLKEYIKVEGWFGMVGCPLLMSFIALIGFYLIAILAQLIKVGVGKKLYAFVLAKIDPSNFVPKVELDNEKRYTKNLKTQLDTIEENQKSLIDFKTNHEKQYGQFEDQINTLKNNINSNTSIKDNFEKTLLILLAKAIGLEDPDLYRNEIIAQPYQLTNGTWEFVTNNMLGQKSGGVVNLTFKENIIHDYQDKEYGKLEDYSWDARSFIMKFKIKANLDKSVTEYVLIRLNNDEMTGFENKKMYCYVHRKDVRV